MRTGRAVVDEAELPVRVDLGTHGLDALAQPDLVGVVHRRDYADHGRVPELLDGALHPGEVVGPDAVPLEPRLVARVECVGGQLLRRGLDEELLAAPFEADLVSGLEEERARPLVEEHLGGAPDAPVDVPPSAVNRQHVIAQPAQPLEQLPADRALDGEEVIVEAGDELVLVLGRLEADLRVRKEARSASLASTSALRLAMRRSRASSRLVAAALSARIACRSLRTACAPRWTAARSLDRRACRFCSTATIRCSSPMICVFPVVS